jgi:tetratricopeptide (TPR) repeat protein
MIVRDEAARLEGCLATVSGLVDEVIVLDTGSRDGTPALARALGARVETFAWCDDFAAARNAAAGYAQHPWILSLDADEQLDPADHPRLREAVAAAAPEVLAFTLPQLTYDDRFGLLNWRPIGPEHVAFARGCAGYVVNSMERLYRNLPGVQFEGRVHELVGPAVARLGGVVDRCDVAIHHYGACDAAHVRRKLAHYVALGERKLADDPDNVRAYLELGAQYIELGQGAAAIAVLERGLARFPDHPGLQLVLAGRYLDAQRLAEAEVLATARLAQIGSCPAALTLLGAIASHRADPERALSRYSEALQLQPDHVTALLGLAGTLAELGDLLRASQVLDAARGLGAHSAAIDLLGGKLALAQGFLADALAPLERASASPQHGREAHGQLAVLHLRAGDQQRAATHLRLARSRAA